MHFFTLIKRQDFKEPVDRVASANQGLLYAHGTPLRPSDSEELRKIYNINADFDVFIEEMCGGSSELMVKAIINAMKALLQAGTGDLVLLHNGETEWLRRQNGVISFSGSQWWQRRAKKALSA